MVPLQPPLVMHDPVTAMQVDNGCDVSAPEVCNDYGCGYNHRGEALLDIEAPRDDQLRRSPQLSRTGGRHSPTWRIQVSHQLCPKRTSFAQCVRRRSCATTAFIATT